MAIVFHCREFPISKHRISFVDPFMKWVLRTGQIISMFCMLISSFKLLYSLLIYGNISHLEELCLIRASGNFLLSGTRGPLLLTAGDTREQGQDHDLQLALSLCRPCLTLDLRQGQDLEAMKGDWYSSFCLLMFVAL